MADLTQGLVEEWMSTTTGDFHYRDILDGSIDPNLKGVLRTIMSRACKKGIAEAVKRRGDGWFRYIKKDVEPFEWWKADPDGLIDLNWPYSPEDNTDFQLDKARLYPNAIIVVSGASNWGKTCFMLNFVMENMDKHDVYYWTNELSEEELADRIRRFNGRFVYLKEDGTPKFSAKPCFDNWQDVINPKGINVIDYLDPGENSYLIGVVIDKLRQVLDGGVVILAIQKKVFQFTDKQGNKHYTYSDYGAGGQYSEHRARLVIHLDPLEDGNCRLWIKKAKGSLTGKKFSCKIIEHGSQFHDIQEITDE